MNSAMNATANVGTEECAGCTRNDVAIDFLRCIANGAKPLEYWNGLCWNLTRALREAGVADNISGYPFIHMYAPLWPEYSGNPDYPVPCQDADDAYSAYYEVDLWVGEYGEARRRLAGFVADELEKELI